jgi:Holliday junction resolvase RusA-like endonuclease
MAKHLYIAVVLGVAGVQGSKVQFAHPETGKMIMIETGSKSRPWRRSMQKAMEADKPEVPFNEAMMVWVRIYVPRPKSHFYKYGLKPEAPKFPPLKTRDPDKTARSIGDAAKKAQWVVDDGLLNWHIVRVYTDNEDDQQRVEVIMWSLEQRGEYFYQKALAKARDLCNNNVEENPSQFRELLEGKA